MDHLKVIEQALHSQMRSFKEQLDSLRESLNSATKSSAGDKHETSRAHVQIEMDQVGKQLHIKETMLSEMAQIDHNSDSEIVGIGNIVETNIGSFCICTGIGMVEEIGVMAISRNTPMALGLIGKSVNDTFSVNGKEIVIKSIK